MANSLSMYSITENIYYSQLSSIAILLQPEPNCFTSYNTRKDWVLSHHVLSPCGLPPPPPPNVPTCRGQRSSQLFCVHYAISLYAYTMWKSTPVLQACAVYSNRISVTIVINFFNLWHFVCAVVCRLLSSLQQLRHTEVSPFSECGMRFLWYFGMNNVQ
jgi:hypothetical protein